MNNKPTKWGTGTVLGSILLKAQNKVIKSIIVDIIKNWIKYQGFFILFLLVVVTGFEPVWCDGLRTPLRSLYVTYHLPAVSV